MNRAGICRWLVILMLVAATGISRAAEPRTSLIIEGGGLPPHSPALVRFVEAGTIDGRLMIGYFPTANSKPELSAARFIVRMNAYGVKPAQIQIINITVGNAAEQAEEPAVVKQISECTALFFGGGDQTRITQSLRRPDGKPTAALEAIDEHRRAGKVIGGTSAGAAMQSEKMIAVSGLPDDSIDEGMDALDFGLTRSAAQPARRGLLVTRGLGFLSSGIIDQHFNQHRGRLARLARAAIEEEMRYGFGIDENAALAVAADGAMEVLGPGSVLIVDTQGATCVDGPLGCKISGVHLSYLEHGDRFDPSSGEVDVHTSKKRIEPGKEGNNGNFLIPDIGGRGAVPTALVTGLANNTSSHQLGITLKHHRHYGHGYQFKFSKTDRTLSYESTDVGLRDTTVMYVRLDLEPIAVTRRAPETCLPKDLPEGATRPALEAVCFRGIIQADEQGLFRPRSPITRAELAVAIAHAIRLEPARGAAPTLSDVPATHPDAYEIALVVAAGLMDAKGTEFHPADFIAREQAAPILVRLAERYRSAVYIPERAEFRDGEQVDDELRAATFAAYRQKLLLANDGDIRPKAKLLREEAAAAIYQILEFPWAK